MVLTFDDAIREVWYSTLNLFKEAVEFEGIDMEDTANEIDWYNYLAENPIEFETPGMDGSFIGGDFAGAGGGKLPIPPGFYSDQVLYNFITNAEGNMGIQWVSSVRGHDIVRSAACFGYDFPGGIHDPGWIKILGLTQADTESLGITAQGRLPIGGESYDGRVKWGWKTKPIPASHPYWKKLIPHYRDEMIWAWNQPIIQAVKDPAERLARMHSINWWGHHFLRGFGGGSGWPHRFQAAKHACAGMQRFP